MEALDINKEGPMASQQFFHAWIVFKAKKEILWRGYVGSSSSNNKYNKSCSIFFKIKKDK